MTFQIMIFQSFKSKVVGNFIDHVRMINKPKHIHTHTHTHTPTHTQTHTIISDRSRLYQKDFDGQIFLKCNGYNQLLFR